MRRRSTLEATAYHEAGHAVAAHLLHTGLRSVTIVPNKAEDTAGETLTGLGGRFKGQPDVEITPAIRDWLERRIRVSMAGDIAQRRYSPRSRRAWHGQADRQHAVNLASYVTGGGKALELYLGWLPESTVNLLALPHVWTVVEAVADALLEHRTLGRKRLLSVIGQALDRHLSQRSS